jgi:hypothetical protein
VDAIGRVLMKDGVEGCILQPIGEVPAAAAELVHHTFNSDNYLRRKIAAALAGYAVSADGPLLKELFDGERTRDSALPPDSRERLYSQSVVEDVVFAAARWCRKEELRPPAVAVLADVVRRTLAGEYWNTASYAMATLRHYNEPGSAELLKQFQAFCTPSLLRKVRPPEHPSRPTLEQERQFAKGLAAGNPATLGSIEQVLAQKDEAARRVALDDDTKQWLAGLLDLARAVR